MTNFETKNMVRAFHVTDVLSALFNYSFSACGAAGPLAFLSFLCKTDVHMWQFERVLQDVKPFIFEQYPELAKIADPKDGLVLPHVWIEDKITELNEYLAFTPIANAEMLNREPFGEFLEMLAGGEMTTDITIIPVDRPDDSK